VIRSSEFSLVTERQGILCSFGLVLVAPVPEIRVGSGRGGEKIFAGKSESFFGKMEFRGIGSFSRIGLGGHSGISLNDRFQVPFPATIPLQIPYD